MNSKIFKIILRLIEGLGVTLSLSIVGFIIAVCLALFITFLNKKKNKVIRKILSIYISFFRGTPLMIQIFFFYFGLPKIFTFMKVLSASTSLIICLSLNFSASISEIIRGSIDGVDKGQYEACHAFGMDKKTTMIRIILPQACISAIPPLINTILDIIKSTSIGLTIGVQDLMGVSQVEAASSFKYFDIYLITIGIYWIVSIMISKIQKKIEFKFNKYNIA